jgi:hypothetical protein
MRLVLKLDCCMPAFPVLVCTQAGTCCFMLLTMCLLLHPSPSPAAALPGEAIKALINEEFGDGIMSAIGFYATVDKMTGNEGEARVVITFNGEQTAEQ